MLETVEEEPWKVDVRVGGLWQVRGVNMEAMGVYGYDKMVVNVRMDGEKKHVGFESLVLVSNNVDRKVMVVKTGAKGLEKGEIGPGQVFRVPLTWVDSPNFSMYLCQPDLNPEQLPVSHLVLRNFEPVSTIIPISAEYYAAVDIC